MKMKLISVIAVLLVCCVVQYDATLSEALRSKIHAKLLSSGMNCIKDHPLNPEHISSIMAMKVPDDEQAKCFINCFYTELGIMDDTGMVSESKSKASARKIFEEGHELLPKIDAMITECLKVNDEETSDGDEGCDRAKLAFECFVKQAPKHGLDVNVY